jgi:hypothetical protein
VTSLVCLFISHARLRVLWAPGIPHALYRAEGSCTTRAHPRRGNADVYLKLEERHCEERSEEAIQLSVLPPYGLLRFRAQ